MRLETLNRWLRCVGLLLVVQTDDGTGGEPTILRLIRTSKYPKGSKK